MPNFCPLESITGKTPVFTNTGQDGVFQLAEPLSIWLNYEGGVRFQIDLAKGFVTNFRSGSDLLNKFIPKFTEGPGLTYSLGILAHDALYTIKGECHYSATRVMQQSKKWVDEMLTECMRLSGIGKVGRGLVHVALAVFGSSAWNEEEIGVYLGNKARVFFQRL